MHIALVTPAYPPLPGGGERYAGALARGLAHNGLQVTVFTSAARVEADFWMGAKSTYGSEIVDEGNEGIRVIRQPIKPFPGGRPGLMLWRKAMVMLSSLPGDQSAVLSRMAGLIPPIDGLINALAAVGDIDIVHAFNISWEHGLVTADAFAHGSRLPLVATPFAHLGAGKGDRVARNSTMDHQLAILRRAARVLVLTDVEQADLASYDIPVDRLAVIGGGVDPPPVNDQSAESETQELPTPYGLFIGRLSADKGALHAAEAICLARRRGCKINLVLVGSTTPDFERYYHHLGPEDRQAILLWGSVPEEEKHRLLNKASFLMLPSRSDSFGIVVLEAWSHEVPVIAARAGGIPGVVDEGENGLLVPYGDVAGLAEAVEQLIRDPDRSRQMGANGRSKVKRQYNWDSVTQRVLGHYSDILGAR
jgi:glycogen synthase